MSRVITKAKASKAKANKPKLLVDIIRGGKVVRTIELEDPRIGFVKSMNNLGKSTGCTARIVR